MKKKKHYMLKKKQPNLCTYCYFNFQLKLTFKYL